MRPRSLSLFQPSSNSTVRNANVFSDSSSDEDEENPFSHEPLHLKEENENELETSNEEELYEDDENIKAIQPNEPINLDGSNFRSDDLELLDYINRLNIPNDRLNFRFRVKKINWEHIGHHFNKPPEEIKLKFENILKEVKSFRTLPSIINDANQHIQNEKIKYTASLRHHPDMPTKPMTSYFLYLQQVRDKKLSCKEAAEMFKNLSMNKRRHLDKKAEVLRQIYKEKMEEFYENHPEFKTTKKQKLNKKITPFSLYQKAMSKKKKISTHETWNVLPVEKKIIYIKQVIDLRESGDKNCLVLGKELEILHSFYGKPDKPPTDRYQTYIKMNIGIKSPDQVKNDWKSMSEIEKEEYTQKTIENLEEFLTEYEEYINRLPDKEQTKEKVYRDNIKNKYLQLCKKRKTKNLSSNKKTVKSPVTKDPIKIKKSKKRRFSEGENVESDFNVKSNDESASKKKKFDNKPSFKIERPPSTFYKYWLLKHSKGKSKDVSKAEFKNLSETKKEKLEKNYSDEVDNYICSLKLYLKSLSQTEMQEYLEKLKAEETEHADDSDEKSIEESSSDDE